MVRVTLGRALGALALAAALAAPAVSIAQQAATPPPDLAKDQAVRQQEQPLNNAPMWREVRSGQGQYTSIPGRETNVLIQSEGQTWRAMRVPIATAGGALIAFTLLVLLAYYSWRGAIGTHDPLTGRRIQRFSTAERIAHWAMGGTFAILGLTGFILTFGKSLLLPLIGYTLFSWLATLSKNLHNFVGPVFSVALPVFIAIYVKHNLPGKGDAEWIAKAGGMLDRSGATHPPSGKFNVGEKALFWLLVVVISIVLVVTGYILNFPNFDQTRSTMQLSNTIHMIAGLLGIAMACFHIYLGTVGMKGALDAMRYGYVDETWAKEHHPLWYEDVMAGRMPGKVEGPRAGGAPAMAPQGSD